MTPARVAVVGTGWRAGFVLDILLALPGRFEVAGVVARSASSGRPFERRATVFVGLESLLSAQRPDFVVLAVAPELAREPLLFLRDAGVPVLLETPPAAALDELLSLHRELGTGAFVQVAEQYHLQPQIAAALAVADSGRLGRVDEARVSLNHGCHAMSVMRRGLGLGFEGGVVTATTYSTSIIAGPGRGGAPTAEQRLGAVTTLAHLDFDGRHGFYDWSHQQNRSWIREPRLLLRGDRGEISGGMVRHLEEFDAPAEEAFRRVEAGQGTNLEGKYLRGIRLGGEWAYRNAFAPARLLDDEIAVASCLGGMARYARTGEEFYSLAEASQDQYLALCIGEAARSGAPVRFDKQSWVG